MKRQASYPALVTGACLALLAAGCSSDDPTSSSATITAPAIQSPAAGTVLDTSTPTLTVANAAGVTGLRYQFQVSTDASFQNTVAVGANVPEGAETTSWTVNPPLETDNTFYWRARATAQATEGPFSNSASFEVDPGFNAGVPVGNALIFDPLTNGMTVGEQGGGEFRGTRGWMATAADTYIRYEIPTTSNGYVQFDVTNLRNPNPRSEKRNLLIMWDPTAGDYTTNPWRVHIAKFDTNLVNRWHMRLRFISNRQERNTGINLFDWDPNQIYTFRLEWGSFPEVVSTQRVRVLLDGREIMVRNYDPLYRPSTHWVELGMAPRNETLEQAIFSNVSIGRRQP